MDKGEVLPHGPHLNAYMLHKGSALCNMEHGLRIDTLIRDLTGSQPNELNGKEKYATEQGARASSQQTLPLNTHNHLSPNFSPTPIKTFSSNQQKPNPNMIYTTSPSYSFAIDSSGQPRRETTAKLLLLHAQFLWWWWGEKR
ncbi:hypothetical protein Droror1_Dr00018582 [Drosera rotundifolia]